MTTRRGVAIDLASRHLARCTGGVADMQAGCVRFSLQDMASVLTRHCMRFAFSSAATLLAALPSGVVSQAFEMAPRYDTVVVRGTISETNPLLLYQQPIGLQFVGPTTVVFADNAGGRLVSVDLVSGRGWEIDDGGSSGPGEFGGSTPVFSVSRDHIAAATMDGQASRFSLDGELVGTTRFQGGLAPFGSFPVGFLESGSVVVRFQDPPVWSRAGPQQLPQGARQYSADRGLIWTHALGSPRTVRVLQRDDGSRSTEILVEDARFAVHARHNTVVVVEDHQRWVRTLNPDGSLRREVEIPYPAFQAFVDANERVWVQVRERNEARVGSYLVFDAELNPLFTATERSVQDAFGDHVVTIDLDENDLLTVHLLRRPR